MLYLASSIATSAVRRSGRVAPSRSRRVVTFHCRRKMRSSSAVLSNPGDSRSGMEFRAVVHFMEAACQKCCAAGFCKLLATLSRGTNRGLTPARTCQDRRKLVVPAVVGREMLGVPYTNRP